MEGINQEYRTEISNEITRYYLLCCDLVGILRAYMRTPRAGNVIREWNDFLKYFDTLYLISSCKAEMDSDILKQVNRWLNKNKANTPRDMVEAITLFDKYRQELYRVGLVK